MQTLELRNVIFSMWNTKIERTHLDNVFKPYFIRYIGIENPELYNDILYTLKKKCDDNKNISICFDNQIPMGENLIIDAISSGFKNLDVNNITDEDIIFDSQNSNINSIFINSMKLVINLAFEREKFLNDEVKKNFIVKLMVWSYNYLKLTKINFYNNDINPKCIYYGNIKKYEIYFLMLLYGLGFDVIYINPEKNESFEKNFNEIDKFSFSTLIEHNHYEPVNTWSYRCENGSFINEVQSVTLSIEQNITNTLFTDGVYKPWQFRKGNLISLFFNSTLSDLESYWCEQSKTRTGFKVEGMTVYVPYFFHKIEGEYDDKEKYLKLLHKLTSFKNTLIISSDTLNEESLLPKQLSRPDTFKLLYCMKNGQLEFDKVKNLDFYTLADYKPEIQNLILTKINEVLNDELCFSLKLSQEDTLGFVMLILYLNDKFIQLIDNFDFTSYNPKIVYFLNNKETISAEMLLIMTFMAKIGCDIVIFDPSGMFNPCKIINENRININRLDTMNYTENYKNLYSNFKSFNLSSPSEDNNSNEKQGFFAKLFGL